MSAPRRGSVLRYVPGDGLYGPIPRDGELVTVLGPCPDSLGDWRVRWASDGRPGVVAGIDLRPTLESLGLFDAPAPGGVA